MGSTEVRFKYIPGTDDTIGSPLPLTDFLDLNYLAVLSCAFSSTSLESELRNEVSSLNMHLKDFLGKKSNRYLEWRDNFTMQIYNLNRMNPVPFIDNLLKELTEPYNEDISTRLEDLASKVLKMLDRQPPPTQGLIDLMPTDIDDENDIEVGTILSERFIRAFMWLVFHMSNEESTSDTLERVVLLLDELHMYYGKIHSIYHFIEYIYIGLEVIAKNESQSDKELLIDFENHLLVFCNKGESARQLFYLELVDDPSPNTNEIDVLVVRLFDDLYSKSSKDSIVFLWKDTFNMINYISDAILSTRDLVIEVSKSINISKREAENILLHSFFKERKNTKSS